ncbi:MAG: hypothetical protein KAG97_05915, partial [Victivallales bacterium]|nr:hypothetical protein [Victivallales bacterium]
VGWPCVSIFPLAHLAWLREHESAIFADDSTRYCMNTDWLLHQLTGQWRMDHSTATTFHLQDQVAGKYHKPYLDMLGIDERKLSSLVDSGTVIGPITREAAERCGVRESTMVVTGSFDHPAAARGVGIERPGQLLLSCGTSWVGFFPDMDRDKIIESELLCDPFLSGEGGPWGAIFSVPQIGRNIDWYVDNLIAPNEDNKFAVFDETATLAEPGAGGLQINLLDKPKIVTASRENIARAVMESAARLLNEKLESLVKNGIRFERAVMVGGPSKSPIWPGIVQDITGIKVTIGSQFAGAIGAAKLASSGCLRLG